MMYRKQNEAGKGSIHYLCSIIGILYSTCLMETTMSESDVIKESGVVVLKYKTQLFRSCPLYYRLTLQILHWKYFMITQYEGQGMARVTFHTHAFIHTHRRWFWYYGFVDFCTCSVWYPWGDCTIHCHCLDHIQEESWVGWLPTQCYDSSKETTWINIYLILLSLLLLLLVIEIVYMYVTVCH